MAIGVGWSPALSLHHRAQNNLVGSSPRVCPPPGHLSPFLGSLLQTLSSSLLFLPIHSSLASLVHIWCFVSAW